MKKKFPCSEWMCAPACSVIEKRGQLNLVIFWSPNDLYFPGVTRPWEPNSCSPECLHDRGRHQNALLFINKGKYNYDMAWEYMWESDQHSPFLLTNLCKKLHHKPWKKYNDFRNEICIISLFTKLNNLGIRNFLTIVDSEQGALNKLTVHWHQSRDMWSPPSLERAGFVRWARVVTVWWQEPPRSNSMIKQPCKWTRISIWLFLDFTLRTFSFYWFYLYPFIVIKHNQEYNSFSSPVNVSSESLSLRGFGEHHHKMQALF